MRRVAIASVAPFSSRYFRQHLEPSAIFPGRPCGRSQDWTSGVRWFMSTAIVHVEDDVLKVVKKPRTCKQRPIWTLDPRNLSSDACIDISLTVGPSIRIGGHSCELTNRHERGKKSNSRRRTPFPQDTRGYLYYHNPPNLPPTAGEVRFRLACDNGPEAFHDLLVHTGLPWSLPLWRIVSQSRYLPIQNLLLEEKLVSEDVLDRCRKLQPPTPTSNEHVIYGLGQPIPISLGQYSLDVWVVGRSSIKLLRLRRVGFTSSEQSADTSSPGDYFHVSIGHDPSRNRFFHQIVAKFEARSHTLVPLKREPVELDIRTPYKTSDRHEALCLLLDEGSSSVTLQQWVSVQPRKSGPGASVQPKARVQPRARPISTFDHNSLQPMDFVDLSSNAVPTIRVADSAILMRYAVGGRGYRDHYYRPFPSNTRGFFYYLRPKNLPDTAGQIRFRSMPNDEPSNFSQGSDLLLPQGVPWSISIWHLASTPRYAAILQSLIQDKIIERALVDRCQEAFPPKSPIARRGSTVIHSLGQPFAVRFGKYDRTIWIVDDDGPVALKLTFPFLRPFTEKTEILPGTDPRSSALMCIEHDGTYLVVRILDIPAPYRDQIETEVGETHILPYGKDVSSSLAVSKLLAMA